MRLICLRRPRNPVDTQFSIPWGVATAIAKRRVTMGDFTEAAIRNREVLDLTARIKAEADPDLKKPHGIEQARVRIATRDGGVYSEQIHHSLGTPERLMSFDDCVKKFMDCASYPVKKLSDDQIERVVELTVRLEQVEHVREIIKLLT